MIILINKIKTACNITYTQAGVSCFLGKESGIFEVLFFLGRSALKCSSVFQAYLAGTKGKRHLKKILKDPLLSFLV